MVSFINLIVVGVCVQEYVYNRLQFRCVFLSTSTLPPFGGFYYLTGKTSHNQSKFITHSSRKESTVWILEGCTFAAYLTNLYQNKLLKVIFLLGAHGVPVYLQFNLFFLMRVN